MFVSQMEEQHQERRELTPGHRAGTCTGTCGQGPQATLWTMCYSAKPSQACVPHCLVPPASSACVGDNRT